MIQFMQATYQNGHLILKQKLNEALEGQTLNIIIITGEAIAERKEHFLNFVDNRDELHAC